MAKPRLFEVATPFLPVVVAENVRPGRASVLGTTWAFPGISVAPDLPLDQRHRAARLPPARLYDHNLAVRIRFDCWTFDSGTRQLVRGRRATRLSPKAFELLGHLLERRPDACSKQELFERLWPDTFVSDATLASLVAELRRALRDSSRKPRFLRTVHGFGYAFCGEALEEPDPRSAVPDAATFRLTIGHREVGLREGENVLGRMRDAVVWVDGTTVSRRHARIVVRGESATLEDLGSKNGTFLRGRRLGEPVPLADGESFQLGDESLTLRRYSEAPTDTSDDAPER